MNDLDAEAAAVRMIVGSRQAWICRELVDLACGPAAIDGLVRLNDVALWPVMVAIERGPRLGHEKGRVTAARRVIFATLTPLGAERHGRQVAERSDCGETFWTESGMDPDGRWLLPSTPITSKGDRQTFGMPYPDLVTEDPNPISSAASARDARRKPHRLLS